MPTLFQPSDFQQHCEALREQRLRFQQGLSIDPAIVSRMILASWGRSRSYAIDAEAPVHVQAPETVFRKAVVRHCALAPEATLLEAAGLLNYLLVDVKSLDETKHKAFTGVTNTSILANLKAVRAAYPQLPLHVRTPVIPGFNDTEDDIRAIAAFARDLQPVQYELLAYHRMGERKYQFLGLDYPMGKVELDDKLFERLKGVAAEMGA